MSIASLYDVCQGHSNSPSEYLAHFIEVTIKVIHPNQEMFVGTFKNSLRVRHFNESLTQKHVASMNEIMAHFECYIKGEERNMEKKAKDVKEWAFGVSDSSQ